MIRARTLALAAALAAPLVLTGQAAGQSDGTDPNDQDFGHNDGECRVPPCPGPADQNANGVDDTTERQRQQERAAGSGDASGNDFGNNSSPTDGATATPGDRNGNGVDDITEQQRANGNDDVPGAPEGGPNAPDSDGGGLLGQGGVL